MALVSFDLCEKNPGALQFMAQAYRQDPFRAERAFSKMEEAGIRGTHLYMLWNDCCARDTDLAQRVMLSWSPLMIRQRINYEGGRGIRIMPEEVED